MSPNRTLRAGLALLFMLMLPLQGFAAMPACGHHEAASPASQHHCDGAPGAAHHPSCGDCCGCAAVALSFMHFTAPPPAMAPEIAVAKLRSPPVGILDRLDRPPRCILA
jgi:hypothetical protein